MTITKRGFICLMAGMLAVTLFAKHHHHRLLPPNAYWCHKCGGDGYNWTWYGWKKTCGVCDGRGWCVSRLPPPPPPPMYHGGKHHHGAPAVAPKHGPKPGPKPGPGGKMPPKGAPRR